MDREIYDVSMGLTWPAFNGKTASAERSRSSQEPQPSPSMSRKKMQRALSSGCAFGAAIVGTDTVNAFSSQGLVGGGSPNSVQQTLMPSYANGSTQALHTPSRGRSGGDDVFPEDPIQVNLRSSAIAALQSLPQSGSRHELSSSASSVLRKKDVMGKRDPREQPHPQWEDMEDELSRTSPMPHPTAPINPIVLLPRRANDDMANVSSKRIESPVEDVHHDLGSDDTSIGMPKEQYRPRASRSRAGLDNSELLVPVDFSKQPETVAKTTVKPRRKKKRCRTTSFEELRPPKDADDGTEEDTMVGDQALEIPIWTDNPLEPQPNAKVEDDENTKTVTAECQKPTQMEEAIQQPKKQRGRPKKVKAVEVGEPATKTPEAVEESLIESTELVTGSAATKTSKTATAVELRTEIEDNRNGRGTQNESNNRHVSWPCSAFHTCYYSGTSALLLILLYLFPLRSSWTLH